MSSRIVTYRAIKPAASCKYDAVALGEVMLRLDPRDVQVAQAPTCVCFKAAVKRIRHVDEQPQLYLTMVDEKAVVAEVNRALSKGGVKASR